MIMAITVPVPVHTLIYEAVARTIYFTSASQTEGSIGLLVASILSHVVREADVQDLSYLYIFPRYTSCI